MHVVRLARRHDGADGKLRADARAASPGTPRRDAGHVLLRGRHPGPVARDGGEVELGDVRRLHERGRHRPRRQHAAARRSQSDPPVGDGGCSVGAHGDAGRDRAHATAAARIPRRRRVGMEHHGLADARRTERPAGADAPREQRRAPGVRAHACRVQPWRDRDPAAGRRPARCDRSPASARGVATERTAGVLPWLRHRGAGVRGGGHA